MGGGWAASVVWRSCRHTHNTEARDGWMVDVMGVCAPCLKSVCVPHLNVSFSVSCGMGEGKGGGPDGGDICVVSVKIGHLLRRELLPVVPAAHRALGPNQAPL